MAGFDAANAAFAGAVGGNSGGGGGGDVTKAYVDLQDSKKVDKVEGKGLSTNDYSDAEKTKLGGIAAGAEVNVQPDWEQSDDTADDYIKHKPDITALQPKTMSSSVTVGAETETTVEGAIGELAGLVPSTAATSNKLATEADVSAAGSFINTATGAAITLTDASDGYVRSVTIKGHSEIVSGEIVSVGDNGLTVTACGKNLFDKTDYTDYRVIKADGTLENRATYGVSGYIKCKPETQYYLTNVGGGNEVRSAYCYDKNENGLGACSVDGGGVASGVITTLADTQFIRICCAMTEVDSVQVEESATGTAYEAYKSTAAEITTGLPLRSASESVYDEISSGDVITRCEVVNDEVVPKATPVVTPLTDTEKAALAGLKTYSSTTHISATDVPVLTVEYFNNSDNGQAVARIDNEIAGKQDKEQGKGLSTNDYTTAEKTKLAGISTGATANTVIDTTCTLTVAGWTGASAPYTQTVNITGMLATDTPILDLSVSSVVATGIDEIDDWALISKAESGAGTLTFSCYEEKPITELNVNIKVVR